MKPVNKKVAIITDEDIRYVSDEDYINQIIQSEYDDGWHLKYIKPLEGKEWLLLFTHAEFDEVEDGDE